MRLNTSRARLYLFVHGTISKCCRWAAFPIFHGDNDFDDSFDENNFVLSENKIRPIFVEMSRKVTVMKEVNNFASVNFGHCGKFKHFAFYLGFAPWNIGAPLC